MTIHITFEDQTGASKSGQVFTTNHEVMTFVIDPSGEITFPAGPNTRVSIQLTSREKHKLLEQLNANVHH